MQCVFKVLHEYAIEIKYLTTKILNRPWTLMFAMNVNFFRYVVQDLQETFLKFLES